MNLINYIKRFLQLDDFQQKDIKRLLNYVPDVYKSNSQYIQCLEFLEHGEWGLALDSLIELADETEGNFPKEYWLGLADAAEKMNMLDAANYCKNQSTLNSEDRN